MADVDISKKTLFLITILMLGLSIYFSYITLNRLYTTPLHVGSNTGVVELTIENPPGSLQQHVSAANVALTIEGP